MDAIACPAPPEGEYAVIRIYVQVIGDRMRLVIDYDDEPVAKGGLPRVR